MGSMKVPKRVWVCRYMYTYACGCIITAKGKALMQERDCVPFKHLGRIDCQKCPGPVMFERKEK